MSGRDIADTMQRALADYLVEALDQDTLRRLQATAREWFDGANSRMRRFSEGRDLPTGHDYAEMADEVAAALGELSADSVYRQALDELREFGERMSAIEEALRDISRQTDFLLTQRMPCRQIVEIVEGRARVS